MIELKQKAIEIVKKHYAVARVMHDELVLKNFAKEVELCISAIIEATENGIQLHDLKKDPSDLPDTDRNVIVYREDEEPTMDNYIRDEDFVGWGSKRYNIEYCKRKGYTLPYDDTIGWCEVPQF